jgi:hypothetical protein
MQAVGLVIDLALVFEVCINMKRGVECVFCRSVSAQQIEAHIAKPRCGIGNEAALHWLSPVIVAPV